LSEHEGIKWRSATVAIAAVTAFVSILFIASGEIGDVSLRFGFIAGRIGASPLSQMLLDGALPVWLTPFSATLVHGGWLHLGFNLLMLVWVGSQVERVLGPANLVFAYLVGAMAAAAAQWASDPSAFTPMIGASGAVSAIFGIYALMAARPKAITASLRLNRAIHVAWLLGAWIVIQWMNGVLSQGQGVLLATPAHIGGFIAGLALQRPLLLWRYRRA
jgi:membrane associated rhomboid family serine protease